MKQISIFICTILLLSGCATGPLVTGSNIILDKQRSNEQTFTPEQVILYLSPPSKSYHTIAMITASAQANHYSDLSHLEVVLIEELRRQAATAGANGIIQIIKENVSGQTVISNTVWSDNLPHNTTHHLHRPVAGLKVRKSALKTISSEYSVVYRGQAILVAK